jgi:hypothetical protein
VSLPGALFGGSVQDAAVRWTTSTITIGSISGSAARQDAEAAAWTDKPTTQNGNRHTRAAAPNECDRSRKRSRVLEVAGAGLKHLPATCYASKKTGTCGLNVFTLGWN